MFHIDIAFSVALAYKIITSRKSQLRSTISRCSDPQYTVNPVYNEPTFNEFQAYNECLPCTQEFLV